uniref:Uncharacterized protein n=1 Tax=Anguilla anguilla TaxID=7936 RepID=A0A0E9X971_ANGAN
MHTLKLYFEYSYSSQLTKKKFQFNIFSLTYLFTLVPKADVSDRFWLFGLSFWLSIHILDETDIL